MCFLTSTQLTLKSISKYNSEREKRKKKKEKQQQRSLRLSNTNENAFDRYPRSSFTTIRPLHLMAGPVFLFTFNLLWRHGAF